MLVVILRKVAGLPLSRAAQPFPSSDHSAKTSAYNPLNVSIGRNWLLVTASSRVSLAIPKLVERATNISSDAEAHEPSTDVPVPVVTASAYSGTTSSAGVGWL